MAKRQQFAPPQFAVFFFRQNGSRTRSSGLATYGDIEATRKQAQAAMRLIPDAAYAELHPYTDDEHYAPESHETVYRETDAADQPASSTGK